MQPFMEFSLEVEAAAASDEVAEGSTRQLSLVPQSGTLRRLLALISQKFC